MRASYGAWEKRAFIVLNYKSLQNRKSRDFNDLRMQFVLFVMICKLICNFGTDTAPITNNTKTL
jgi:hypothetical protein